MTLSEWLIARYLMTRSVARSLCDSWASCWNKAPLSKNANFSYPLYWTCTTPIEPLRIFAKKFNTNCPSPWAITWYKILPKSSGICCGGHGGVTSSQTGGIWQTDGSCYKPNVTYSNVRLKRDDPGRFLKYFLGSFNSSFLFISIRLQYVYERRYLFIIKIV